MLLVLSIVGCSEESEEDLFNTYSIYPNFEYMQMFLYYLNNLPYYLNDQTDEYYVIDSSGIEKEESLSKFLEANFEDETEKIRNIIPRYMFLLNLEKTFGDGESELANYYKNKLFYFGDKMYLSSVGELEAEVKGEKDPKKLINNYLEAIKNADATLEYKFPNVFDYYNVLDYKYLDTKESKTYKDFYIIQKYELEEGMGYKEFKTIEDLSEQITKKTGLEVKVTVFGK